MRTKRSTPVLPIIALMIGVDASRVRAQISDAAGAQAVGVSFLRAVQAADWKAAVGFLDLAPLERHRLQQVRMAQSQRNTKPVTAEDLMRMDPQMPRAVAEFEVSRMSDQQRSMVFLEQEFGTTNPDSLLAIPIDLAAQWWLEVHDGRWSFRRALRASTCPPSVLDRALPEPKFRVLGTVVADTLAYLLYTTDDEPSYRDDIMHSPPPRILLLRRGQDTWWIVPRVEFNRAVGINVSCSQTPKR
jgi:hypothetical protein